MVKYKPQNLNLFPLHELNHRTSMVKQLTSQNEEKGIFEKLKHEPNNKVIDQDW